MLRRRRPIMRTAAVAATATAVSRKVSNKMDSKKEPAVEEAAVAPAESVSDELTKLASLHQSGVLSDEEFAAAKAKLLA